MITPAFNLTATERVLPKLALDFTTASLDSRVTFTRTTNATNPATYINSNGFITAATNNQPRFDYDPVSLACKGLLIEESRSNLCKSSQDFSSADWSKVDGSITTDSTTNPQNENTSQLFTIGTAGTGRIRNSASIAVSASTAYTASIVLKKGNNDWCLFQYVDQPTSTVFARTWVNLSTGQIGSTVAGGAATNVSSGIINLKNGWYRVWVTGILSSTTLALMDLIPVTADNSETRSSNGSVYLYGAQLEAGAFATSYIPTEASALTRNADVASMTGTNFSDWFNATEGTFLVQATWEVPASLTQIIYEVHDGTANNRYRSFRNLTSTVFLTNATVAGSADVLNMGTLNPLVANTVYKTANSYKTNLYRNYFTNDTALGEDTSAAVIAAPTTFQIGTTYLGTLSLNGYVQKILYWPRAFTVPEMRAFVAI